MGQHYDPDDPDHEDLDDDLGRPIYHGSGLSVRELTAEELQRFLDAHAGQPAQRLGSGWAALDPSGRSLSVAGSPVNRGCACWSCSFVDGWTRLTEPGSRRSARARRGRTVLTPARAP
jgi:hypothetical protein